VTNTTGITSYGTAYVALAVDRDTIAYAADRNPV